MLTASLLAILGTQSGQESLNVSVDRPTVAVSRSLFGIFFEEINNAGEGGLYAELLLNRALVPGTKPLPEGWLSDRAVFDSTTKLNESQAGSIFLDGTGSEVTLQNTGFWGIAAQEGATLELKLWVKGTRTLTVDLVDSVGKPIAARKTVSVSAKWGMVSVDFVPTRSEAKGHLRIVAPQGGTCWLGYSTLMPAKTYKNRSNGLRPDLASRLNEMKPGFVRFPGGCYVEGNALNNCFPWRDTIVPIEERKPTPRTFWGYISSNGLGYHEYLQLCEDLGSEAMFVINCGMSHSEITPMDQMHRWVKDALDAIEYANGDVSTPMGALRAKNGHPKSFGLKYVEIGNENGYSWAFGGPAPYYERFDLINKAIKAKYPEIVTISNVPVPAPGDLESEHYYNNPEFFWKNKDRYDSYDRKGSRVYVGEYAVTQGNGRGSLAGALSEAAFMTGMERNADIVAMASYAPLFENINQRQWNPNAIVFDGSRSYGTPSYWVQQVFANNRVDVVVLSKLTAENGPAPSMAGRFGLKTWQTNASFKNFKVVVGGRVAYEREVPGVDDFDGLRGDWGSDGKTLTQSRIEDNQMAFLKGVTVGDGDDWTYEFDARVNDGREAFMPLYSVRGRDEHVQWNIGGWGNTIHAFQRNGSRFGRGVEGSIKKGVWVHVRVEKKGGAVSGFMDGRLVETVREEPLPSLASSVGVDVGSGELVLKLVNGANRVRSLRLDGVPVGGSKEWLGTVLRSGSLTDENTLDRPELVVPRSARFRAGGVVMVEPLSLTVVRVPLSSASIVKVKDYLKRSESGGDEFGSVWQVKSNLAGRSAGFDEDRKR